MTVLQTGSRWQVSTIAGLEAGAQIFSYAAGTLTPLSTFTNQGGGSANTNPVICDANGEADVWLTPSVGYRFIVKRAVVNGGATISDVDNITGPITAGSNATFADLTTTGNNILGNATTDTLNVGANGIVKDATGLTGFGLAPTAAQGLVQLLGSSTGGIKLGNTNNSYANALDWYEEGTWTPALKMGGLFGVTTYSAVSGTFTRIGNIVFFMGQVQINAYDLSTGGITFSATVPIPYAAVAGTYPINVTIDGVTLTSPGWMAAGRVGGAGAPDVTLRINSAAGSVSAVAGTNITLANGAFIAVEGFYRCA